MLTRILATLSEVTAAKALPVVGVALAAGTATVGATGVTQSAGGERTKIVRDVRVDTVVLRCRAADGNVSTKETKIIATPLGATSRVAGTAGAAGS